MKDETVAEAASTLAGALEETFVSRDPLKAVHSMANAVDGLFYIGQGLFAVAKALERLGTGNASTEQGAIEVLAETLRLSLDYEFCIAVSTAI